ncbi:MAG TPA: HNH endonuclease signature motif containing protein [Syntrophomonadaceae bacterium]|nr:HNH endonuclease signature motif containing protein [Syntrophomonadaceae bacterium]
MKPMKWGGLSVPENLQLLCRTCNLVKGDKQ